MQSKCQTYWWFPFYIGSFIKARMWYDLLTLNNEFTGIQLILRYGFSINNLYCSKNIQRKKIFELIWKIRNFKLKRSIVCSIRQYYFNFIKGDLIEQNVEGKHIKPIVMIECGFTTDNSVLEMALNVERVVMTSFARWMSVWKSVFCSSNSS